LLAFSTASSGGPADGVADGEFGVPRRIVSFVLPTGYSFNLTTQRCTVAAAIFVTAAGKDLSIVDQLRSC
jgi:proton glutamate symport protein